MEEKELRKNRSKLRVLGTSTVVLTMWNVVKTVLVMWLAPMQRATGELTGDLPDYIPKDLPDGIVLALLLGLLLFVAGCLGVQIWVGLSARAEGFGRPKGKAYIVAAFFLTVVQVFSVILTASSVIRGTYPENSLEEAVVSVLFEFTCLVIFGELAVTASKLKRQNGRRR